MLVFQFGLNGLGYIITYYHITHCRQLLQDIRTIIGLITSILVLPAANMMTQQISHHIASSVSVCVCVCVIMMQDVFCHALSV